MGKSSINILEIKKLIENNLTDDLSLESIFKGIKTSYYYEAKNYKKVCNFLNYGIIMKYNFATLIKVKFFKLVTNYDI